MKASKLLLIVLVLVVQCTEYSTDPDECQVEEYYQYYGTEIRKCYT